MPKHNHEENIRLQWYDSQGGGPEFGKYGTSNAQIDKNRFFTASTGGGAAHNNMQPYLAVVIWTRTA